MCGSITEYLLELVGPLLLHHLVEELLEELGCDEHAVDSKLGDAQPMVRYPVVRPVVRADLLVYVALPQLVTLEFVFFGSFLLLEYGVQSLLEFLERPRLVGMLVPLVLARGNDARGLVSGTHRAIGLVDVLPARTRRPVRVNPDVLLVN